MKTTDQQRIEAVSRYLAGEPTTSIAKSFGTTHVNIRGILLRRGVKMRNKNTYSLKHDFFATIGEKQAYVLGMLAADGYHDDRSANIRLELSVKDLDILEKIRSVLDLGLALRQRNRGKKTINGVETTGGPSSVLNFTSRTISDKLILHGIVRGKSLIYDFPETIPEEQMIHFLRGYIDGDGSIICSAKRSVARIIVVATESFCVKMKSFLKRRFGIKSNVSQSSRTQLLYHIEASGPQAIALGKLLYADATIFGERKRNRFIECTIRLRNKQRYVYAKSLLTGEEKVFKTQLDAAKALGINNTCISDVCRGKTKSSGGYFFKIVKDPDLPVRL